MQLNDALIESGQIGCLINFISSAYLFDQMFNTIVYLSKHVGGETIILSIRIWNVPENYLSSLLKVIRPFVLLHDENDQVGCMDHFRGQLLPFPIGDIHSKRLPDVLNLPSVRAVVFEFPAQRIPPCYILVHPNASTIRVMLRELIKTRTGYLASSQSCCLQNTHGLPSSHQNIQKGVYDQISKMRLPD